MVRRESGNFPLCRNMHQRWRRALTYQRRSEMFLLVTDFIYMEDGKWLVKELVVAGSHKNCVCRMLLVVRQIVSANCYWLSDKSCLPVVLAVRQIVSADCYWLSDKSCLPVVTGCQTNRVFGCYWLSDKSCLVAFAIT